MAPQHASNLSLCVQSRLPLWVWDYNEPTTAFDLLPPFLLPWMVKLQRLPRRKDAALTWLKRVLTHHARAAVSRLSTGHGCANGQAGYDVDASARNH